MALLEPIFWQSKKLPIYLNKVVLAPDPPVRDPYSPVPTNQTPSLPSPGSEDSGFNSSPSTPSSISTEPNETNPLFASHRLIAAGGTGFSLAVVGCDRGSLHQLSVPLPEHFIQKENTDLTAFTLANISAISIVGEAQIWAGTSIGTVHCFELTAELRLKNHAFINMNEPILCIASRPQDCIFPPVSQPLCSVPNVSLCTEVLIGLPYGYIIVMAGESDSRGHLRKAIDRLSSRRIIRFTNSPVDCSIRSIVHVQSETDGECYWCGCGGNVFVLRSTDWKKVKHFDARLDPTSLVDDESHKQEVLQLVSTEVGVWSYLSCTSAVTLWDKTSCVLKLRLNYCNTKRSILLRHDTTSLHYTHPYIFIGTNRGDIIIFKITENDQDTGNGSSYEYTFISSTNIGEAPIINIVTTTDKNNLLSRGTPTIPNMNVFATEGGEMSTVHMLEVVAGSAPPSHCSTPMSDITVISLSSLRNNSLTPKRISVVSSSSDFVPLKN